VVVVGVHIADGEWRTTFMAQPRLAKGFGVAATPWQAVQRATSALKSVRSSA
jgi:hypothetical protein